MLRIFGKLRRSENIWPWLHGIAFNKVRNHYGKCWRRRTRSLNDTAYEPQETTGGDALAEAVTAELKQVVVKCIGELEPRHRAVLTLRCYEQMSYAHIAERMSCSEIAVRALFCRAKKALAQRLSAHGLGKGSLLLALVVFGKMTATSEAAVAQVSVTTATLQAGPLAGTIALLTGKATVITVVAAGALVAGSVAVNGLQTDNGSGVNPGNLVNSTAVTAQADSAATEQECWHYFPQGPDGPVMMRQTESRPDTEGAVCRILENQYANYHADERGRTVSIDNYRAWKPDLTVRRLPTDSAALSAFISEVEGRPPDMERTAANRRSLLVACRRQGGQESRIWRINRHANVLAEEYFQFSWPESTRVIDRRDAMHERGWTYFQIDGELGGVSVSGCGRVPFVYAANRRHWPWLELRLGGGFQFVDTPGGAHIREGRDRIKARYPGGSFFSGLPRPWQGLHCIDAIRRDAAERHLPFETTYDQPSGRTTITIRTESTLLQYTLDMEADLVEKIVLWPKTAEADAEPAGELRFTYLQNIDETQDLFTAPAKTVSAGASTHGPGILWLTELTNRH
jgi:RNA polymerase sigma factor (sigma-70 family)